MCVSYSKKGHTGFDRLCNTLRVCCVAEQFCLKNATVQIIIWRRIMVIQKIVKGFVILKNRDDKYDPTTAQSINWKH